MERLAVRAVLYDAGDWTPHSHYTLLRYPWTAGSCREPSGENGRNRLQIAGEFAVIAIRGRGDTLII
jgi:hypothetical protein